MRTLALLPTIAIALLTVARTAAAQEPAPAASDAFETKGRIDAVTVYRGQAQITRLIELSGKSGLREVVVTDLPEQIVPSSIYAETADGIEVRSVRYRQRPVLQDVREEVRELEKQIAELAQQIEANNRFTQLAAERKAYFDKLEQFTAATANVELTQGVLNADTLRALSEFLMLERTKIVEEGLKLSAELTKLQEDLALVQRKREVVAGGSARSVREAVVFVNLPAETGRLRLRYLVAGATWSPSYNVRAADDRSKVTVEYNAMIQQLSGEDWSDVSMTLSTATPSLVAMAPELTPLSIRLSSPQPATPEDAPNQQAATPVPQTSGEYAAAKENYYNRRLELEAARNINRSMYDHPDKSHMLSLSDLSGQMPSQAADSDADGNADPFDFQLNEIAAQEQVLDLLSRAAVSRFDVEEKAQDTVTDEGVSVTYELAGRTSLPSRADQQLIQIASLPMQGEFYKVATPVLTSYVYEQARVTNEGKLVLLAGPVSAYAGGQFVGHGKIPTVAVGESFALGFGIDASLRAKRELVDKTETIQGGNRVVEFTYRLALENFGTQEASVRLLDRLPTARESEVKLTLVCPGKELSSDADYQQAERKQGILRWEVAVAPQAIGPKAEQNDYKFRLEYDKQMSIAGLQPQTR